MPSSGGGFGSNLTELVPKTTCTCPLCRSDALQEAQFQFHPRNSAGREHWRRRTPVRPVPTECPKLIVDIWVFWRGIGRLRSSDRSITRFAPVSQPEEESVAV